MENDFAKNEKNYIRQYESLGYTDSYRFVEGRLSSAKTNRSYGAGDISIVKMHRYEGMSNPSDMSLLYVIETSDGQKGTLLAAYGPDADAELYEFLDSIPDENVENRDILPPDAGEQRGAT